MVCCAVDLLQTKEIICRAWDRSMNTQPNSFTWNIMGMMNNCVYRVKVCPALLPSSLAAALAANLTSGRQLFCGLLVFLSHGNKCH